MACFSCDTSASATSSAFAAKDGKSLTSTALFMLLQYLCGFSQDMLEGGETVTRLNGQCNVTLGNDLDLKCGMDVDIFAGVQPSDFVAIPALFEQAERLNCSPEKYPIKAIISGGGYSADVSYQVLSTYLTDLQHDVLIASAPYFDINTQLLKGPSFIGSAEPGYAQHRKAYGQWNPHFGDVDFIRQHNRSDDPLRSFFEVSGDTMAVLTKQAAPLMIALRPIVEFPAFWAESVRGTNLSNFRTTSAYEEARRTSSSQFAAGWNGDATTMSAEILQLFQRSHVVAYQGKRTFAFLGRYLAKWIIDPRETANTTEPIRHMEEAFVNLPERFVLVDRRSLLANPNPPQNDVFTFSSSPMVMRQFRWRESTRTLLRYNEEWNSRAMARMAQDIVNLWQSQLLDDVSNDLHRQLFKLYRQSIKIQNHLLFPIQWIQPGARGALMRWRRAVQDFQQKLTDLMPQHRADIERTVQDWADYAIESASNFSATSLLLPLCSEPGNNIVRQSLVRVKYSGQDPITGDYDWPSALHSASSIYFTKYEPADYQSQNGEATMKGNTNGNKDDHATNGLNPNETAVALARKDALKRDLRSMYGETYSM